MIAESHDRTARPPGLDLERAAPAGAPFSNFARSNAAFLGVVAALGALWFLPVCASHFADADQYLAHVSAIARFDHVSPLAVYEAIAAHFRALQPGWFPLGPLPLALWLFDLPLAVAKALQFVFLLTTLVTFAAVVRRMLGSTRDAVLCCVFALCAWQFRFPHDPVVGTSFVTPWLAESALLMFLGWFHYRDSGDWRWLVAMYAALLLAMLTSPIAWGLGVVLAALTLVDASTRAKAWSIGIFMCCVIGVQAVLGPPAWPWHHPGAYVGNVVHQLLAAVPATYRAFGHLPVSVVPNLWHGVRFTDDRFVFVPAISVGGWLAVVACSATTLLAASMRAQRLARHAQRRAMVFGLGFWLVPALFLGPPRLWQRGLPAGQAFDGVYLEYFGIAVLGVLAVRHALTGAGRTVRLLPVLAALAVFVTCYGNVRADAVSIARWERIDDSRSLLQRAGSSGLFELLPEGSTIAVASDVPFANGLHFDVTDAKYALYHYAGRKFRIVPEARLGAAAAKSVWILRTSRKTGIFTVLAHWRGRDRRGLLVDRALGSAVPEWSSRGWRARGVSERVTGLRHGRLVTAERLCGPVPVEEVFAPSRPTLAWGRGFYSAGPYGYSFDSRPSIAVPWGNGYYPNDRYPKMFMSSQGALSIDPTPCEPGVIDFKALATAAGPATLSVYSANHTDHIHISVVPVSFWLRYEMKKREPIHVVLKTDAPPADLDHILFRYERDRPRDLRLVLQATEVLEQSRRDASRR